jgi:hypothetical protein
VIDQIPEALEDGLVGDQVKIVDHQREPFGHAREVVDQRRQDAFCGLVTGRIEHLQGFPANSRIDGPQRGDDAGPELPGVVVAVVDRQPRRAGRFGGRVPVAQQGGLSPARRRGDQDQLGRHVIEQPIEQFLADHGAATRRWRLQR